MSISAKALSLVQELRNRMARRTTLAVSDLSFDTDGGAWFLVGAGTAGSQSMVIKAKQIDPVGFNGIGLAATGYAQSVFQVVVETSTIANVSLLTGANFLNLMGEVLLQGARTELYMSPNTNPPDVTDIVSANLKTVWEPDLQYRLMDSQ